MTTKLEQELAVAIRSASLARINDDNIDELTSSLGVLWFVLDGVLAQPTWTLSNALAIANALGITLDDLGL